MQKQQQQEAETLRTDDALPAAALSTSDVTNSNLSQPSGIKRFIKRESPSEDSAAASSTVAGQQVRTNRAARLRAAATSATPPPVESK